MERQRHRLDRRTAIAALCLGLVLVAACEDTPVGTGRSVRLLQPLTMSWSGQSSGVPYDGGQAVFSATAALRVVWSFRIEAVSRPPSAGRPRYVGLFENQEHIQFNWDGHNNIGIDDFAPGDSCVASVSYQQLGPEDADEAKVGFQIVR